MRIGLAKFIDSLSIALDYVEKEILNVSPYHGQRVASITNKLATSLEFEQDIIFALTYAALLHDCALNEYFEDEKPNENHSVSEKDMALHCYAGEKILSKLPFYKKIEGAVLYHHETADGNGAYRKKAEETPIFARLIHLADILDVNWSLSEKLDEQKYNSLCKWVKDNTGTLIDKECSDLFFKSITYDFLSQITGNKVLDYFHKCIKYEDEEIPIDAIIDISSIFADITDYKSHFTWRHSLGIAEKAKIISKYYNYSEYDCKKMYIAGALHDIGKLLISNDILEKPGKLDADEYKTIQNHAIGSFKLLEGINGLEEIKRIASLHHEKLDGSGYPFGYTAENLSKDERLMACLDIYQALVEERPYKKGLSHDSAIKILKKMGDDGQLDKQIIEDIDNCFKNSDLSQNNNNCYTNVSPKELNDKEVWQCPVCGYLHEGTLPKDFICPHCEQPASVFKKI